MAHPLQYRQAAQRIGLPPACARKHRSDGPEAYDALTIKPDHPMGALQSDFAHNPDYMLELLYDSIEDLAGPLDINMKETDILR